MQIIGDPVGSVEVKVLTSQTHMYKVGQSVIRDERVRSGQEYLEDKRQCFVYFSL